MLDISVRAGEVVCLLGPNGSGKTTLFKTLLGLLARLAGSVSIAGRPIESWPRQQLARHMAYVPQAHSAVFPYHVLDMVLMGRTAHLGMFSAPSEADREQALAALQLLGIEHLANREYTRISGGQRQLALIARALAQDAPAIVMDEPTASLDFGNQALVLTEVKRLAQRGLGIVLCRPMIPTTRSPSAAVSCCCTRAAWWPMARRARSSRASGWNRSMECRSPSRRSPAAA